jgi:hypothetical protein
MEPVLVVLPVLAGWSIGGSIGAVVGCIEAGIGRIGAGSPCRASSAKASCVSMVLVKQEFIPLVSKFRKKGRPSVHLLDGIDFDWKV